MKLHKRFALLISMILIVTTLAACGGSTASTTGNSDTQTGDGAGNAAAPSADAPAASGSGVVNLSFMGWEASPLEAAAIEAGIAKFEQQYPNINVEFTTGVAGGDYNAKLLSSFAGGTMPDIMFMNADSYRTFVDAGALADITDKFGTEFPLDDFIDSSRTIMEVNGHVYGISSCTVSPVMYYNKNVFDAAGIPYPSAKPEEAMTIAEFRELAKKLTAGDVIGLAGAENLFNILPAFFYSNGENEYNADYTKSGMNNAGVAEVLRNVHDIRHVDKASINDAGLENSGMSANQMLQTGKVAMIFDGSWALQELATMDFPIGRAPLPKFKEAVTVGQAHLHCIASTSPHQAEAWEFLKFLSGLDYQGQLCKEGLWMPNRKSMYENVEGWYDEKVHGTEYKEMLDYFQFAKVHPAALAKSNKCNDIINEEVQNYFQDVQDLDTALSKIESRVNEELNRVLNK